MKANEQHYGFLEGYCTLFEEHLNEYDCEGACGITKPISCPYFKLNK